MAPAAGAASRRRCARGRSGGRRPPRRAHFTIKLEKFDAGSKSLIKEVRAYTGSIRRRSSSRARRRNQGGRAKEEAESLRRSEGVGGTIALE